MSIVVGIQMKTSVMVTYAVGVGKRHGNPRLVLRYYSLSLSLQMSRSRKEGGVRKDGEVEVQGEVNRWLLAQTGAPRIKDLAGQALFNSSRNESTMTHDSI